MNNFQPLKALAVNAKKHGMAMQCKPDAVLQLFQQGEQLAKALENLREAFALAAGVSSPFAKEALRRADEALASAGEQIKP